MMVSTMPKEAVVQYVTDLLQDFGIGLQSITIMKPLRSEDCSVLTVISMWSEDTDEPMGLSYFKQQLDILTEFTRAG